MSRTPTNHGVPPWVLAVCSSFSVQLGSALSLPLINELGAAGTAWLRLSIGAVIFIVISRPSIRGLSRGDLRLLVPLGITSGIVTISFLAAIDHLPLGTAVSIEFLGPLTIAAFHARTRAVLVWPALALCGVVLLTEPWQGHVSWIGILWAGVAATGWGTYIVLTEHVGNRFEGVSGLALAMPISALTAAIPGIPQAVGHLSVTVILAGLGLAVLLPVLPYAFEMLALRKMTRTAFGTIMALEPAFGLLLGLIVLAQHPNAGQMIGIALVVVAGAGAQRGGRRDDTPLGIGLDPPGSTSGD